MLRLRPLAYTAVARPPSRSGRRIARLVLFSLGLALVLPTLSCAQASARGPQSPDAATPAGAVDVARLRDTIGVILDAAVRDSAFPGAIAVIGTRDGVLVQRATGHLDWPPAPSSVPDDRTLWDLASLTKVVALTSALLQLTESGKVDLDAPVGRYVPEWRGGDKERVTVRQLLMHSSGLPAWRPLYKEAETPGDALALIFATPLDTVPGARMVYSDLGAILLGQVVERASGEPFAKYVASHVFEPLGMRETMFLPSGDLRDRIAPTEFDPWRQRHLRGEVHDENAFALGGISSHAGLFSTAHDLSRFARAYLKQGTLDGVRVFSAQAIERFTTVRDLPRSDRALGWETPNGTNSAGHLMSSRAFGHTGFTGTSLWIDPARNVFVLLLSNRVNPTREHRGISAVRVALADAAMSILGEGAR
jgi:CubicO group peptidase (beta-lactamase class C family)